MPHFNHFIHKSVPDFIDEARVRDVLKKVDVNRDGKLDKKELREAARQLGALNGAWRAFRALKHADANNDGLISEEEQEELVKYLLTKYKTT
ncbi:putative Calcium-binding EF-hand family protein [Quillaja saponaria]|uniref:Calcium-binding EF-hand family protein n=1 Tax=Quillaja saponaria TaxID=32244 RepID=A0AAD7LYT4_QUISA|nr:putative Calcium-binding EF-hand family protein [Quillaja saponaria]